MANYGQMATNGHYQDSGTSTRTPDTRGVSIAHCYTVTLYIPTMHSATDSYTRQIPSARRSVIGFAGQNPCRHWISPLQPSTISTTASNLSIYPQSLLVIFNSPMLLSSRTRYSALGGQITCPARSHLKCLPPPQLSYPDRKSVV